MRITRGLLLDVLRDSLGTDVDLAAYAVANRRPEYRVILARLRRPDMQVSIKLAGPGAPFDTPFDRAARLLRLVAAQTDVPVPEVLAVDTTTRHWPWRILVTTAIPGQEFQSLRNRMAPADLRAAYGQIGRAVAGLHALRFPAFGPLDDTGPAARGLDLVAALAAHARRIVRLPRLADLYISALDDRASLLAGITPPCLCHEDLHGHNIIFRPEDDGWHLAAILDFDKAWAGHHEMDLARMELWTGMTGDGFWPAYLATMSPAAGYPERRPLYQLLWCLEYAEPSPRHLSDTRAVCRELGLPAIESFD